MTADTDNATAARPPRRLLVLASDIAPLPSVGRLRVQKFCALLPRYGWQVRVVTFDPGAGADPHLLSELPPDLPIERTAVPRPIDAMIALAKGLLRRPSATTSSGGTHAVPSMGGGTSRGGLLESLSRVVDRIKKGLGRRLLIPDENRRGISAMTAAAVRLARQWKPDAMLVSVPGFSPLLAAARAQRQTGVPLVVDYRDLWHGDVMREWIGPLRRGLERAMERRALARCRGIVAVTNGYLAEVLALAKTAGFAGPSRWISNGFDAEEFPAGNPAPAPREEGGRCRAMEILHAGRLFKNRTADGLLTALGELRTRGSLSEDDLRLTFLGEIEETQRRRLRGLIERYGLSGMIAMRPYVPRSECLRLEQEADCLLVIGNAGLKSAGTMSMKLFEYAGARRPVLALVNEGEARQYVLRSGLGRVAPISDVPAIERTLADLLVDWRAGRALAQPDAAYLQQFRFEHLARQLAEFLDDVIGKVP